MNPNHEKPHLSYSAISTYLTCPLKYKFHYIDQLPPAFTSSSLAFGSAIHEAVGAFLQSHLEGDLLRYDQILDVYVQAWKGFTDNPIRYFNGDNESSLFDKAHSLLRVFYASFDPSTEVLGVEEFFEVDLDGVPPLIGYIDLIEQSPDGTIWLADLKTASEKPTGPSASSNLQLTAYSLGAASLGFDPEHLGLRLDVLVKTKSPEFLRLETSRTGLERERFVKMVTQVWNGIESGVCFPKEDWYCAQCPYRAPCSEW
ncbi:MAG: PD-(D/E)XK nuclease family protein [Desulfomonile sp.]|nr:PD-(D/E)XK nuclease family protein [Desulfomonile sp.]